MVFGFGKPNIEKMWKKDDIEGLIKALNYKKDPKIIGNAAKVLGILRDDRAVEPLIKLLEEDILIKEDPDVSDRIEMMYCVRALSQLGDDRAVEPLLKLLEETVRTNKYFGTMNEIFDALGYMKDDRAVEPLNKLVSNIYIGHYNKNCLVDALSEIGDPSSVYPLLKESTKPYYQNDEKNRAMILENISRIGESAVDNLLSALNDKDRLIQIMAGEALGMIGNVNDVEVLNDRILNDPSPPLVLLLGTIGDNSSVKPLIRILEDDEAEVYLNNKKNAAIALGMIGDPLAVEPLINALNHKEWNVRKRSAEALGNIEARNAVKPLINLLLDKYSDNQMAKTSRGWGMNPNEEVRYSAARALEKIDKKYSYSIIKESKIKEAIEEATHYSSFFEDYNSHQN